MLIMVLVLSLASFALMDLMPGDPLDQMIASNPRITSADIARLKAIYGEDKPVLSRYARWLGRAVQGDLGYSRTYRVPVPQLLGGRLVNTFVLSLSALVLALAVAVPLGVWAALRAGSKLDYTLNFLAFAGISTPAFFLGILLIIVFAVQLPWLPASGAASVGGDSATTLALLLDRLRHLILPACTLAALQSAIFVRYTRAAMLEVMHMDYIRTARAKGLSPAAVVFRHGLRNALIPVLTVVALHAGTLFSGAVITETVFAYQGMGKLVYDSVMANDYNVAMVAFMITVVMVLTMNLGADLLYAKLDPRITYR